MEFAGTICLVIAAILSLFYGIMLIIVAFQQHILWGLGCLLVPFVLLAFVIMNWDVAKKPFLRSLLAIPFYILGMILMPGLVLAA